MRMICETDHEVMLQRYVGQKLRATHTPQTKCKSEIMLELVNELRHLGENMFVPRGTKRISLSCSCPFINNFLVFDSFYFLG